jgi:hypothetical protein
MSEETETDRRRWRRRSLPFVRSAVLEVEGRPHIVVVSDIGREGAFLSARVAIDPSDRLLLRLVVPGTSSEVEIPCRLVWKTGEPDAERQRPAGFAVRFEDLPDSVGHRVASFARDRLQLGSRSAAAELYEYRVLEQPDIGNDELNRLGLDGWLLTAAVPTKDSLRLIFVRRL